MARYFKLPISLFSLTSCQNRVITRLTVPQISKAVTSGKTSIAVKLWLTTGFDSFYYMDDRRAGRKLTKVLAC